MTLRAVLAGAWLAAAPAVAQMAGDPSLSLNRHLQALAANPRNADALIGAGQSALASGDAQSAAAFFARAEEVRPRDGRIKAGIGASLIQLEQPQAALKFFADAITLGQSEASVAGERGLAFDLIGDSRRAQRDYRLALQRGGDDEVRRRLALSLAISGDRAGALAEIDDQLRRQDRSAWRTRAFVLALTGDTAGAGEAAGAVMGPQQAGAMRGFFGQLPRLNPAQRAMAVHLGVFPADGRATQMAQTFDSGPSAPALLADNAGVLDPATGSGLRPRIAPTEPISTAPRRRPGATETADAAPTRFRYDPATRRRVPVTETIVRRQSSASPVRSDAETAPSTGGFAPPRSTANTRSAAAATPPPTPAGSNAPRTAIASTSLPAGQPASPRPTGQTARQPGSALTASTMLPAGGGNAAAAQPGFATALPTSAPATTPGAFSDRSGVSDIAFSLGGPVTQPQPAAPIAQTALPPSNVELGRPTPTPVPSTTAADTATVLPRVAPPRPRFADVAASIAALAPETVAAPPQARPEIARAVPAATAPIRSRPYVETAAASTPRVPKVDKPKTTPPARPSQPSRHWVQVAGGANKATLPREYTRLKGLAPKLLGSREAWTTPLRATNRLLVGPFDSLRAAQAFVNDLGKSAITAFAWTSPAGQEIAKLPAR